MLPLLLLCMRKGSANPFESLSIGFLYSIESARRAKIKTIRAIVTQGDLALAEWLSYSANKSHGLRRTNEEKQRAVKSALTHPKGEKLSNRKVAEHVGVDERMVRKWREELEASAVIPQIENRTATRKGKEYTVNTAKISAANKARAKAKPAFTPFTPEAEDELWTVLRLKPGAYERWQQRQQQGLSDDDLLDAIADELAPQGTFESDIGIIEYRGGKNPMVTFEHGGAIAGQVLVQAARKVLDIPLPQSTASPKNGSDRGPAEVIRLHPEQSDDPALTTPCFSGSPW